MTYCYKLSALIYYLIVSVEVPSQLGGFSAWSHGAEGKVSGLLRVSGASSKPTGCWRNSFSLVVGLRSLFSCQFKIFFGCGPFLKSLLEKKKKSLYWMLQYCFYFKSFWPQGMWDLSSLTRDWTHTPSVLEAQSLNHQTTNEVPLNTWCLTWVFAFSQASWSQLSTFSLVTSRWRGTM